MVRRLETLCVSGEENTIQVDPLPPGQCWVLQVNFVPGGMGKNVVKAVFMSVFCRVSFKTPSVKFRTKTPEKEEASQNLLARILFARTARGDIP